MSLDAARDQGEITVGVVVGRYCLDVGDLVGTTVACPRNQKAEGAAERKKLSRAVRRQRREGRSRRGQDAERAADNAERVTDRVDRAVVLFREVASGSRDIGSVNDEIDALLGLLWQLDRDGRFDDELRLARALSRLLAVALRWLDLLRSLCSSLRAARQLGDEDTEAWALHELGALHMAAGKLAEADRMLSEARRIRTQLGNRRALAVTERNLQVLCRTLRDLLHVPPFQRLLRLLAASPPLAVLAAAVLLVGGAAAGAALGTSNNHHTSPTHGTSNKGGSTHTGRTTPPTTGASGAHSSRRSTIKIALPTITFTSGAPPRGSVDAPYSFNYAAGGDSGITYTLTGGPPGLSLSSAGVLSGTPKAVGEFPSTVTATGESGAHSSQRSTITVALPTITFTSGAPPPGSVDAPYSFNYAASGDSGITYTLTGGPPGLSLSSAGVLSGTPKAVGEFRSTVTATGESGAHSSERSTITVVPVG